MGIADTTVPAGNRDYFQFPWAAPIVTQRSLVGHEHHDRRDARCQASNQEQDSKNLPKAGRTLARRPVLDIGRIGFLYLFLRIILAPINPFYCHRSIM